MKRLVPFVMSALLITGTLMLAFHAQPVRANGTIYIRADGSIDPLTAQVQWNGEAYILTDNISSSSDGIVIERNDCTLDGANHAIQGVGTGNGITLLNRSNITIRNVKISNFASGIVLTTSSDNELSENNVSNNIRGIDLFNSSRNILLSNIVKSNNEGIYVYFYSSNNTLTDNAVQDSDCGITLMDASDYNTVSRNRVSNNNEGITLVHSLHCTFFQNNLKNNHYGMILTDPAFEKIYHNNFLDNAMQAMVNLWCSPHISWHNGFPSGGNYWSDLRERYPNAKERDTSGIWDTAYPIEGAKQSDPYPLMYSFPRIMVPDDYSSVQEAIDHASDGDTIFVRNGTYFEDLMVDKSISLVGEDSEGCIIDGNNAGFPVARILAHNVTVTGFTIRNSGFSVASPLSCIYAYWLTNLTIHDNILASSDCGIFLEEVSQANVFDNKISNCDLGGIYLSHSGYSLVRDNHVEDAGNNIWLHYSNNNTVSRNDLVSHWSSQGIFLYYSSNNVLVENVVNGSGYSNINIYSSNNNKVKGNVMLQNWLALTIQYGSSGNEFLENILEGDYALYLSDSNRFYHNNFYSGLAGANAGLNTWNSSCEGNYWSDYYGNDSNGDGIGDTLYVVDSNNIDNYPLVNPYWIPADINHDLKVGILDVVKITGCYATTPSDPDYNPHADIAAPYGKIDILDVVLCTGHYAEKYP